MGFSGPIRIQIGNHTFSDWSYASQHGVNGDISSAMDGTVVYYSKSYY